MWIRLGEILIHHDIQSFLRRLYGFIEIIKKAMDTEFRFFDEIMVSIGEIDLSSLTEVNYICIHI